VVIRDIGLNMLKGKRQHAARQYCSLSVVRLKNACKATPTSDVGEQLGDISPLVA
jgi:hypothetical protein